MAAMRGSRAPLISALLALTLVFASCWGGDADEASADGFLREEIVETTVGSDRCDAARRVARITRRGLYGFRSPEVIPVPKEPNFIGGETTLVHSGPWDYLTHVPFVMYGPGHVEPVGDVDAGATLADVAPTTAAMIGYGAYRAPDGKALDHALSDGPAPRLVVTIVWDGGGWNVLERHAGKWPYLAKLMQRGANYTNFSVGSSPSVTPATHTNLGTGSFPQSHGVVGLRMRTADYRYVNPLGGQRVDNLEVTSLSDLYDRRRDNKPKTGMLGSTSWHLGMIGKGASFPRGDKDPVVLMSHNEAGLRTNEDLYSLPRIGNPAKLEALVDATDLSDGERDGKWLGRPLEKLKDAWRTPALVDYTEFLLERMIVDRRFGRDRVPDLLYVNFKSADLAGHAWSFNSEEVGEIVGASDRALKRLVRFLDRRVGERRWAIQLTADHGMTPYPKDSGAFPVRGGELAADLNRRFDTDGDDVRLIDKVGAAGIYVRREQLDANGVGLRDIGDWVADYRVGENLKSGESVPSYYEGTKQDRIFDTVLVGRKMIHPSCP